MMRKFFLAGGLLLVLFAACKKDDTPAYDHIAQLKEDTAKIGAYLRQHGETATLDTAKGIYYKILAPGNGVDSIKYLETKVKALYKGWFLDGTAFDSTGTTPREFYASDVITGWQYAFTKVTKGGKLRIYLPSLWGYGRNGKQSIPPNTVLIFDMEIVDVTNPQ